MRSLSFRVLLLVIVLAYAGNQRAHAATLTVGVVDQATTAVADTVVYAVPVKPSASNRPPVAVEIVQQQRTFSPLVTVVQTGASVSFPNRDTVRHQVYSFSPAKTFELRLYAGVPVAPLIFDKPGLVVLGCNIHDRMVAYVMVVDTPWYGKTADNGVVRIEGLPPGEYRVSVWHPRMTATAAPRTVLVTSDMRIDAIAELKPAT